MAGNDETLRLKVEAETAEAKRDLAAVQKQADKLEGDTATVEVDADTSKAKADLGSISDSLGKLPGPAGEAADAIGGMGGGLSGAAGAAGALGAALFAAADHAADLAIEAQTMATLTGDTVENASALQAVWKSTGADVNDLNDIVLQMQGALATNEDAAKKLGINIHDGKTGAERFVEVMEKLRDFTGTAAEKSQLMSTLLGEEGARQGAKFLTVVGDIDDAMGDLSDQQIITDDEVQKALQFKDTVKDIKQIFADMATQVGEDVMPAFTLLGEALKATNELDSSKGGAAGMFGTIKDAAERAISPVHNVLGAIGDVQDLFGGDDTVKKSAMDFDKFGKAVAGAAADSDTAVTSLDDLKEKILGPIESLQQLGVALDEANTKQQAFFDAQRAAADSSYAVESAVDDLLETIQGYDQAVTDAEGNTAKLRDVQDGTRDSAAKYADAQVRLAEDTAMASGAALSAEDSHRIWLSSMLEAAAFMNGPQKAAIIDYISRVEGIPPEKVTEILADPDNQSIDGAAAAIDEAAKDRDTTIKVTADTSFAESQMRAAISRIQNGAWSMGRAVVPASSAAPTGPTATQTAATTPVRYGGTVTNNITLNTRATSGREVTRELDRWARLNGRQRG